MWRIWELAAADLTLVALLDVLLNVGFHAGPEVALHDTLPRFEDSVVSR